VRLTRHDKDKDFDVITSPVIKTATVAFLYCITVKIGFLLVRPTRQCDAALAALAKRKFCAPNLRIVDVLTHFFPLLGAQRPVD
jgi:hypothetical protein